MNPEILEEVLEVLRKVPGVWKRVLEVEEDLKVHEGVPGVLEEASEALKRFWRFFKSPQRSFRCGGH